MVHCVLPAMPTKTYSTHNNGCYTTLQSTLLSLSLTEGLHSPHPGRYIL